MKLDAVPCALEFVGAFAGIGVAAAEFLSALAKADFIAERSVHNIFQEPSLRIRLRNQKY